MKSFNIIPYFISMEGCKSKCIYCNQYSLKSHRRERIDILDFVIREREKYRNKNSFELAFYGGTFFYLPKERLKIFRDKILELKEKKLIEKARISTTPDSINDDVLSMFKGIVDRIEIGVQSLDDLVLKFLRRNYGKKEVVKSVELLRVFGYEIGFQIMIGLPFESRASYVNTISEIINIRPDFIRLYPLFIPKKTPLSIYYRLGFFKPISKEELLWRGMYSMAILEKYDIKVIKVGLNEFVDDNELDFIHKHDDLRGWFISEVFKNAIEKFIEEKNLKGDIEIFCKNSDYQYVVGINKDNLKYFKDKGYQLKIIQGSVKKSEIRINDVTLNVFDYFLGNGFLLK